MVTDMDPRICPSCLIKLAGNSFCYCIEGRKHNWNWNSQLLDKSNIVQLSCPSELSRPRAFSTPHRTARLTAHAATCWKWARARSRRGRGASWASPRTTPPSSASATAPSPATRTKRLQGRLRVSSLTLPQLCQNIQYCFSLRRAQVDGQSPNKQEENVPRGSRQG